MTFRSFRINFRRRWSLDPEVWNTFWENLEADLLDLFSDFASFSSTLDNDIEDIKDDVIGIIPALLKHKEV